MKKLLEQNEKEITEISFSDSSIIEQNDIYYLFTTVRNNGLNQLRLFCSSKLLGEYHEHPKSPVCVSNKFGRNAGSLIEYSNKLFRLAQDCENSYGDNVHVLKIDELSINDYQESVVKENIFDRNDVFYKLGGHQLNVVEFKGKTIIATDAKEYHLFIMSRLLHKIGVF